jgi:hypothetical protein
MSYNMMICYDIYDRFTMEHDFDDQFFLLATLCYSKFQLLSSNLVLASCGGRLLFIAIGRLAYWRDGGVICDWRSRSQRASRKPFLFLFWTGTDWCCGGVHVHVHV